MYIYIDVLFIINLIANYLIMITLSKVSGIYLKRYRVFFSSLFGAIFSILSFFIEMSIMFSIVSKILCAVIMIFIAFGKNYKESFLRLSVLFFLVTTAYGGVCLALQNFGSGVVYRNGVIYMDLPLKMFALSFGVCYFIVAVIFNKSAKHNIKKGELSKIVVDSFGKKITFDALKDSGNDLIEPISGKKVIFVERNVLMELFPEKLMFLGMCINSTNAIEMFEKAANTEFGIKFRVINYNSLGNENASILAFNPENVLIDDVISNVYIGISPSKISNGAYCAVV